MHIVLTDILTCPGCGEAQGLIVRADRIADRHVEQGSLGCPQCRRQFPIRDGVAWLAPADAWPRPAPVRPASAAEPDPPIRVAALLGLQNAKGFVLLVGTVGRYAAAVAALADTVEVVAADADAVHPAGERVSRLVIGDSLPFSPGKLRGIWLAGAYADSHLEAAARALHPTARLVLEPAPDDAERRLPAGLRVIARQDRTVVCARAG